MIRWWWSAVLARLSDTAPWKQPLHPSQAEPLTTNLQHHLELDLNRGWMGVTGGYSKESQPSTKHSFNSAVLGFPVWQFPADEHNQAVGHSISAGTKGPQPSARGVSLQDRREGMTFPSLLSCRLTCEGVWSRCAPQRAFWTCSTALVTGPDLGQIFGCGQLKGRSAQRSSA